MVEVRHSAVDQFCETADRSEDLSGGGRSPIYICGLFGPGHLSRLHECGGVRADSSKYMGSLDTTRFPHHRIGLLVNLRSGINDKNQAYFRLLLSDGTSLKRRNRSQHSEIQTRRHQRPSKPIAQEQLAAKDTASRSTETQEFWLGGGNDIPLTIL